MGLSSTTDKQKEAAWRAEFEAPGEQLVFVKQGAIYKDEAKRQAALRWLSERDRTAQLGWLAFFVAIAGGACQHHCFVSGGRLSLAFAASRRLVGRGISSLVRRISCPGTKTGITRLTKSFTHVHFAAPGKRGPHFI